MSSSLGDLQQRNLLRAQRPTIPLLSSSEVRGWQDRGPIAGVAWQDRACQLACMALAQAGLMYGQCTWLWQQLSSSPWAGQPALTHMRIAVRALSTQALISQADLDAWVNGTAPAPNFQTVAAWRSAAIHSSSNTQLAQPSWNSCSGSASASCSSSTTSASAGVGPSTSFRKLKLFSLNDYLGLASHQDVCSAAASAALAWGNGPRSSGIVGGTTAVHR